ncbi:MAG: hypothetical protein KKF12_22675 [Proteobacteria bacterium]|nr:hypothetical protein [Desulfobacula sp.]MBU4133633.1 hypothetical protein [Pseudomonadota bacterium]
MIDFSDVEDKILYDQLIFKDKRSFIQQSSWWAEIVCRISGDTPIFVCCDKTKLAASMYFFKGKFGNILVSNIQPGSLGTFTCMEQNPDKRREMYRDIITFLIDFARLRKCISITVTDNPLIDDEKVYIEEFLQPEASMETFIQVIELEEYFDQKGNVQLPAYLKRTCLSRNINKSMHHGFDFSVENSLKELMKWYNEVHCVRIKELKGTPLPVEIFQNIGLFLGKGNAYFFKITKGNKILAGALCICRSKGVIDNYMMSASTDAIKKGVNYFLMDNLLKWCFLNKMTLFNWQSSNPPDGGIFRFKKHWGSKVLPYSFYCKILDKKKFRALQQNDLPSIQKEYEGHFLAPYPLLIDNKQGRFSKKEIVGIAPSVPEGR